MFVPFFMLEHTRSLIVCRAGSSAAGRRATFSKLTKKTIIVPNSHKSRVSQGSYERTSMNGRLRQVDEIQPEPESLMRIKRQSLQRYEH